jgi:hypothetical protein
VGYVVECSIVPFRRTIMAAIDKQAFEAGFPGMIERVASSERVTKDELKVWCNSIVAFVHAFGTIERVNTLMSVLTPVNKKVAREFFSYFLGYSFDEKEMRFTSKSKKRYLEAVKNWETFSSDPLNNIWTWAERHIEVQRKGFDLKDTLSRTWKNAHKANISNNQILSTLLSVTDKEGALVFSVQDVVSALESLSIQAEVQPGQASPFFTVENAPRKELESAPF